MSRLYRRLKEWVLTLWDKLLAVEDAPHAIAGGVAIGVLLGFTPFFGLKTVLALALAWVLRCSRVAAVIAVTLHDVTLPFSPFLMRWEYEMGRRMTSTLHHPPPDHIHLSMLMKWEHWREWFHWRTIEAALIPLFLGSLVIAIPAAVISFFVIYRLLTQARKKHGRHSGTTGTNP